jgi:hypothetical protein
MCTDEEAVMTKLIIAFRNIAKEPIKKYTVLYLSHNRSYPHTHTLHNNRDNEYIT